MLHRAIVGSLERFIGILIEHHAGALPLWLAPVQAVVLNITDRQAAYAEQVAGGAARRPVSGSQPICATRKSPIKFANIACRSCPTSWSSATRKCRPNTVAVRTRGGEDLGAMPLEALLERLRDEVAARR